MTKAAGSSLLRWRGAVLEVLVQRIAAALGGEGRTGQRILPPKIDLTPLAGLILAMAAVARNHTTRGLRRWLPTPTKGLRVRFIGGSLLGKDQIHIGSIGRSSTSLVSTMRVGGSISKYLNGIRQI